MTHQLDRLKMEAHSQYNRLKVLLSKPLTRENIYFHYCPLAGMASYTILSINVINPSLSSVIYTNLGLSNDLGTSLSVLSTLGLTLHLYNRQTFAGQSLQNRCGYSFYHTGLFVLGSVLSWAVMAKFIPNSSVLRTGFAILASTWMLQSAQSSLNFLDSKMGVPLGRK